MYIGLSQLHDNPCSEASQQEAGSAECGRHVTARVSPLGQTHGDSDVSKDKVHVQWSLYFKTTHGTQKMWSRIAGGLKIKVI